MLVDSDINDGGKYDILIKYSLEDKSNLSKNIRLLISA
jgi:hypothetical protein